MDDVIIENSELIPVDSLLYKLDMILNKYGTNYTSMRYTDKSLVLNIIHSVNKDKVKPFLLEIFSIIEHNYHYINNGSNRGFNSHISISYLKYYKTNRIFSPTLFNYAHNNYITKATLNFAARYRKFLDGKFYLNDIYYIVYIKRENILEFLYLLFYDQFGIEKFNHIFEVHVDEDLMNSKDTPEVLKNIYSKLDSYTHIKQSNIIENLKYPELDENKIFEKLYNEVCNSK